MTDAPIFITGLPRSGTSLVAGCIALSGAWVGDTFGPDAYNKKGTFENIALREKLLKPYLTLMPADPLGIHPLPPRHVAPMFAGKMWREKVLAALARQGYRGGAWVYKDAKLALCYRQWVDAFPEARWIIVRRERDQIIDSVLGAEPMARRLCFDRSRVEQWHDAYVPHLDFQALDVWVVQPQDFIKGDFEYLEKMMHEYGLRWQPDIIQRHISRELWHGSA